jgi:hypothetical protein
MRQMIATFHRIASTISLLTLGLILSVTNTHAIDKVRLEIVSGGEVGAFLASATERSDRSLRLELVLLDPRGSATGWSVSLSSHLVVTRTSQPLVLAGQRIVAAGPHSERLRWAPLLSPRTTLWAERGAGSGNYLQRLNVRPIKVESENIVTVTVGLAP